MNIEIIFWIYYWVLLCLYEVFLNTKLTLNYVVYVSFDLLVVCFSAPLGGPFRTFVDDRRTISLIFSS